MKEEKKYSEAEARATMQVCREMVLHKLRALADVAKRTAWNDVLKEHGQSLEALDGIVKVLVNRGADPDVAARLAMRYWARGWNVRFADALRKRWNATEEEVAQLRKEIESGEWWDVVPGEQIQ